MKTLVFHGRGDIRYEENWPDPAPPTADEVTIAVSWCAICGTDIEDYTHGGIIPIGTPHPTSGRMAPLVFGHEFVGRVAEVGKNVKHLRPGQKVAVECVMGCGKCYWCAKHEEALCPAMVSIGQHTDGGMAEYVNVPKENCIPLPDDADEMPFVAAEPFAVTVRAMRMGRVKAGRYRGYRGRRNHWTMRHRGGADRRREANHIIEPRRISRRGREENGCYALYQYKG